MLHKFMIRCVFGSVLIYIMQCAISEGNNHCSVTLCLTAETEIPTPSESAVTDPEANSQVLADVRISNTRECQSNSKFYKFQPYTFT